MELLALAGAVLNAYAVRDQIPDWAEELARSLRIDGFDAIASDLDSGGSGWLSSEPLRRWSIVPLGGSDAPLAPAISVLASELRAHGLLVAGNHFNQAFDSFKSRRWESCNAQLRSTLENVLVEVTKSASGWTGDGGGQALDALRGKDFINKNEYDYLRGLWGISHTNGSHPGMSNETESELRLTSITAAIRFILYSIPSS